MWFVVTDLVNTTCFSAEYMCENKNTNNAPSVKMDRSKCSKNDIP